jgi:hypothetical protein
VLWDSDSGKRLSHIASPDVANTPAVIKSLLLGDYLIVLYGDNSIIIYEYLLEKILKILKVFPNDPVIHLILDAANQMVIAATENKISIIRIPGGE